MPQMLNVSFNFLSENPLDEKTLKLLRRKYYLPKYTFSKLKGKRFEYPGQILKDKILINELDHKDLFKLIVPPFSELGMYTISELISNEETFYDSESEISINIYNMGNDSTRIALRNPEIELISVQINNEGELDPTTIKFGGYWFWEWPKLPNHIKSAIIRKTYRLNYKGLKILGNQSSKFYAAVKDRKIPVRDLAQLGLFFFSSNVYRNTVAGVTPGDSGGLVTPPDDAYDPGEGMPLDEYPQSNECTFSPDYPFSECCVAHDYCYVENVYGCDECARLECDLDFLECMLKRAGKNPAFIELAFVYFIGVRAGGGVSGFDYCSSAPSGTGGVSLGAFGSALLPAAVGIAAGFTIGGLLGGPGGAALGVGAGLVVAGGVAAGLGKVYCELCEEMVNWVEQCEADRRVREERCERQKKKCKKKKKWWKKLWCKIKYFWNCVIVEYIRRGLCWLIKEVVYPVTC